MRHQNYGLQLTFHWQDLLAWNRLFFPFQTTSLWDLWVIYSSPLTSCFLHLLFIQLFEILEIIETTLTWVKITLNVLTIGAVIRCSAFPSMFISNRRDKYNNIFVPTRGAEYWRYIFLFFLKTDCLFGESVSDDKMVCAPQSMALRRLIARSTPIVPLCVRFPQLAVSSISSSLCRLSGVNAAAWWVIQ